MEREHLEKWDGISLGRSLRIKQKIARPYIKMAHKGYRSEREKDWV